MPTVDLDAQYGTVPVGPLRDKLTVDISSSDYVEDRGFVCQAATAGDLTYRTHQGEQDQTEAGLDAGDAVEVAGVPVALRAVRSSSTVTSIVVGLL